MIGKEVRIEIGVRLARVSPPHEALLAPLLTCAARRFAPGGPLGHQRERRSVRFYRIKDGVFYFPSIVVAQVEAELRRAGVDVQAVHQQHQGADLDADDQFLQGLPTDDRAMLEAVRSHPCGVINVARPREVAHAVGLVCRLWPRARLLVPVPTRREVRDLYDRLQPLLGDQLQTTEGWQWGTEHRVLVTTLAHFDNCNELDWDVVLYPDPLAAVARGHRAGRQHFRQRRSYGFLPRSIPLDKRMALTVGSCIGPVIYRAPDAHGYAADVRVNWLTPPWCPAVSCDDALERKRVSYWHNNARNDFIAAVAQAASAADTADLSRLGLSLDEHGLNGGADGMQPRVTILVESNEHAQDLLRRLSGWELWSMAPADRKARRQRAYLDLFSQRIVWSLDKKIVTLALVNKLMAMATDLPLTIVPQCLDTDVLIRADGAAGALSFPYFPPRSAEPGRSVLLLDLADDFDEQAADASRGRHREYVMRGWTIEAAPRWLRDEVAPALGLGASDDQMARRHRKDR